MIFVFQLMTVLIQTLLRLLEHLLAVAHQFGLVFDGAISVRLLLGQKVCEDELLCLQLVGEAIVVLVLPFRLTSKATGSASVDVLILNL